MPASIQCEKCGEGATLSTLKCPKCGARVVKLCPACGAKNSLAKNYCDSCGELLSGQPKAQALDPAAKPPNPPPGPIPWDMPKTGIVRVGKKEEIKPISDVDILKATPPPSRTPPVRRPAKTPPKDWRLFSTLAALGLLCVGFLIYSLLWAFRRTPQALVEKTALSYLTALKNRDYKAAYDFLSSRSKANCTLEEFQAAQDKDEVSWDFGPLAVESMDLDWALAGYELRVAGHEGEKDWLHFVREDSGWMRAYWWNLMEKIESAFDEADTEGAMRFAQAAVDINPRDPMARGYLCEAAYYHQDSAKAELECSMTLNLLEKYPSRLNPESIYHLHAILADTYKNRLERYREAAREYEILLAFPNLSDEDRCDLLLARADARMLMQDSEAIRDFQEAAKACTREEDLAYARHGTLILSGEAGPEAAQLAQRQTARQGNWVPEHAAGARYKVSLRDDKTDILTADVDLWTREVKVDSHVP